MAEYSAHVYSQPALCLHSFKGNCPDGIGLIIPGTSTEAGASYAVQSWSGSGFASFEDEAAALRTLKTAVVLILPNR